MHKALDDTLFPFVRVGWKDTDLGFVDDSCAWLRDVVQPRAQEEGTKVVVFQNYADFSGLPSPAFAAALSNGVKAIWDPNLIVADAGVTSLPELTLD